MMKADMWEVNQEERRWCLVQTCLPLLRILTFLPSTESLLKMGRIPYHTDGRQEPGAEPPYLSVAGSGLSWGREAMFCYRLCLPVSAGRERFHYSWQKERPMSFRMDTTLKINWRILFAAIGLHLNIPATVFHGAEASVLSGRRVTDSTEDGTRALKQFTHTYTFMNILPIQIFVFILLITIKIVFTIINI